MGGVGHTYVLNVRTHALVQSGGYDGGKVKVNARICCRTAVCADQHSFTFYLSGAIMRHSCWMPVSLVLLGVEWEVNAALGGARFVFVISHVGNVVCISRLREQSTFVQQNLGLYLCATFDGLWIRYWQAHLSRQERRLTESKVKQLLTARV
jgi:hypothetical protein